jgi:hypothetical protein
MLQVLTKSESNFHNLLDGENNGSCDGLVSVLGLVARHPLIFLTRD